MVTIKIILITDPKTNIVEFHFESFGTKATEDEKTVAHNIGDALQNHPLTQKELAPKEEHANE